MRTQERKFGPFTDYKLGQFCSDPRLNGFDEQTNVLTLNFCEEKIQPYDGSLSYAYDAITKMNTLSVIRDEITYRCGIQKVRAARGKTFVENGEQCFQKTTNRCQTRVGGAIG